MDFLPRPQSASQVPGSSSNSNDPHSFPYFSDGNVVISALTVDGVRKFFKVHMSILSYHSVVFADMFTFPAPRQPSAEDMYDGVPLVHLPDDASDVTGLLKVIYDPSKIPLKRMDPDTPVIFGGILRLAMKYEIDGIRTRIVNQLESDWPQSLVQWESLESEISIRENTAWEDWEKDNLYLDHRFPEPASAISLARSCSLTSVLPAAFYHLSRLKADANWDDWHNDHVEDIAVDRLASCERSARWNQLAHEDLVCLLRGKDWLHEHSMTLVRTIITNSESATCRNRTKCSRSREALEIEVMRRGSRDLLNTLQQCYTIDNLKRHDFCLTCAYRLMDLAREERANLWSCLPRAFHLD